MTTKIFIAKFDNQATDNINNYEKQSIQRNNIQKLFDLLYKHNLFININYQTLSRSISGRPICPNNSYDFNISHTDNYIAISILNRNKINDINKYEKYTGIDIETSSKNRNYIGIASRYIEKKEKKLLLNSENLTDDFYLGWTLREACLKSQGKGIYHLKTVVIDDQNSSITCNMINDTNASLLHYKYKQIYLSIFIPYQYNDKFDLDFYFIEDNNIIKIQPQLLKRYSIN